MQFFANDQSRVKQALTWGTDGVIDYIVANGLGTVVEKTFNKQFPIENLENYATSEILFQTAAQIAISTILHTFLKKFADVKFFIGDTSVLSGGAGGGIVTAYALWSAQPNLKKKLDSLTGVTKYIGYAVIAFIIATITTNRLMLGSYADAPLQL